MQRVGDRRPQQGVIQKYADCAAIPVGETKGRLTHLNEFEAFAGVLEVIGVKQVADMLRPPLPSIPARSLPGTCLSTSSGSEECADQPCGLAGRRGASDGGEDVLPVRPNKAQGFFHNSKKRFGLGRIASLRDHSVDQAALVGDLSGALDHLAVDDGEALAVLLKVGHGALLEVLCRRESASLSVAGAYGLGLPAMTANGWIAVRFKKDASCIRSAGLPTWCCETLATACRVVDRPDSG